MRDDEDLRPKVKDAVILSCLALTAVCTPIGALYLIAWSGPGAKLFRAIHNTADAMVLPMPKTASRPRSPQLEKLHAKWVASARQYASSIGHSLESGGIVPEQAWDYLDAASRNGTTICETGFYKGVSAHLWLSAHSENFLHSFDMKFPEAAVAKLRSAFGSERLLLHEGSTRDSLPRFRPGHGNLPGHGKCELVSIDAGHEGWDPYDDFVALAPHTRCDAPVFFDDTFDDRADNRSLDNDPSHASFYNACTRSYWRLVREGKLRHVSCTALGQKSSWGRFPKGFCVGRPGEALGCPATAGSDSVSATRVRKLRKPMKGKQRARRDGK